MYLFFDTETTGVPLDWHAPVSAVHNWPRLVHIAWLQYERSRRLVMKRDHIIKPRGFTIPQTAAQIHGITTERAKKDGVALNGVLKAFSSAVDESSIIVAHNMNFDEKIIGAEFIRAKVKNALATKRRICTMEAATPHCKLPGPHGYKWPKLSELYQHLFGKGLDEAHNPVADVEACMECFFELKKLGVIRE